MATTVTLKPNAIDLSGSTSGTTTLQATAVAGTTTITLPAATDTLVGKATTDTLTNKTLTTPVISTISNTGTLTLPTSTDTLVGRATTDTLTNKTLTTPVISSLSSASATALTLQSAGTTAITVDTSQNVGIGTTAPQQRLGIKAATNVPQLYLIQDNVANDGYKLFADSSAGYLSFLRTSSGSDTERMRISSGGYVTMPYQPIFAAYRTSSQTGTSPFTIVFDTASLNVGSNYSTSTGRFTAPIAGNYYLIFQTLGITGTWNSLDIILYKNGSSAPAILSARPTSTAGTEAVSNLSTAFGIVTLAASDYVEIKVAGTTIYSDGNAWLKFGGWLVC